MLRWKSLFQCWSEHPAFTCMIPWASLPEALEQWVHVLSGSPAPSRVVLHVHGIVGPRHGAHCTKAPRHLWGTRPTVSFQGERHSFYNIHNKFIKFISLTNFIIFLLIFINHLLCLRYGSKQYLQHINLSNPHNHCNLHLIEEKTETQRG